MWTACRSQGPNYWSMASLAPSPPPRGSVLSVGVGPPSVVVVVSPGSVVSVVVVSPVVVVVSGSVVDELVVVLVSVVVLVVDELVVLSPIDPTVVVVSSGLVVTVVEESSGSVVSAVLGVVVDVVTVESSPSTGEDSVSSWGAGPILPRPSREVDTSMSGFSEVGELGSSSSEKPMAGMPEAGGSTTCTLTAFRASGAATAAAVTVERDSASKNRPRPVEFLGRSKYIYESDLRAKQSRIVVSHVSSRNINPTTGCGIDNPPRSGINPMKLYGFVSTGKVSVGLQLKIMVKTR